MLKKQLTPVALTILLTASPLVLAEEAHHPERLAEDVDSVSSAVAPASEVSGDAAAASGSATMQGMGMMPPGMMEGMQGMGGGPGSGMMRSGPGMMGMGGMMGNRPMMDGKMMRCMQGMGGGTMKMGMMGGHPMMQKHREVVTRLDLIDARLAKIEALFERLIQR